MAYVVKHPPVESVREDLVRLWTSNLPVDVDAHAKFAWYYRQNPLGPGEAVLLETDQGGDDGKSAEWVGCAGIGLRRFALHGVEHKTALLADLAVEKKHRTVMPALVLTRGVRAHCQREYPLVYGFPNKHAEGLFARLGYVQLGKMTRYALVLRHADYAARKIPVRPLAEAAGFLVDGVYRMAWLRDSLARRSTVAFETMDAFDPRFDDLWRRAKGNYPIVGYRGADFLRWRFRQNVGLRYEIMGLRRRSDSRLDAYVVVENENDSVAHVADVFGADDEHVETLLAMLATHLRARGFTSMSIRFLGMPSFVRVLGRLGFQAREANRMVIADAALDLADRRDVVADPSNWYVLDGDEDS